MGKPGETKLESYRYNSPVTSRFFSKFLFPRNTVTNIFKPNLLQTFLGRRRRAVGAARMLNFQLEDQQWLGESYNLLAPPLLATRVSCASSFLGIIIIYGDCKAILQRED